MRTSTASNLEGSKLYDNIGGEGERNQDKHELKVSAVKDVGGCTSSKLEGCRSAHPRRVRADRHS